MLNYSYLLTKKHLFQQILGIKNSQFRKLLPKFSRALRKKEYERIPSDKRIRIPGGGRKSKLGDDEGVLIPINLRAYSIHTIYILWKNRRKC